MSIAESNPKRSLAIPIRIGPQVAGAWSAWKASGKSGPIASLAYEVLKLTWPKRLATALKPVSSGEPTGPFTAWTPSLAK